MSWRDHIEDAPIAVMAPWVGGRVMRFGARTWKLEGDLPREMGWYAFETRGRKATAHARIERPQDVFSRTMTGFLVGDRFVDDDACANSDPVKATAAAERVYLIDPGFVRFSRVQVNRVWLGGPLFFRQLAMPLGPESAVRDAYEDRSETLRHIYGVTPALEVAFRLECWQRQESDQRRAELARRRQEAEDRRVEDARRAKVREQVGSSVSRRALARFDFAEAARAALAVGGAEFLDFRPLVRPNEVAVRFRLAGRRFECTCDVLSMQVIDSGICLAAEYDDQDFERGTRGDTWLTLESLPSAIQEADEQGRLVVYRHV